MDDPIGLDLLRVDLIDGDELGNRGDNGGAREDAREGERRGKRLEWDTGEQVSESCISWPRGHGVRGWARRHGRLGMAPVPSAL